MIDFKMIDFDTIYFALNTTRKTEQLKQRNHYNVQLVTKPVASSLLKAKQLQFCQGTIVPRLRGFLKLGTEMKYF